jgi:spore germination cell wall hydrolase CwlJ-like protein
VSVPRKRPKRGRHRRFGLAAFIVALLPTNVGYQDLAALIAQQPGVSQRWREHVFASPFGTIHAATFSFPRPMGTAIPDPYGLHPVSFDPRSLDVTGSIPRGRDVEPPLQAAPAPIQFPRVDRSLKGDLLVPRDKPVPVVPPAEKKPAPSRDVAKTAAAPEAEPRAIQPVPESLASAPKAAPVQKPEETRLAALPPATTPQPAGASKSTAPSEAAPADAFADMPLGGPKQAGQEPALGGVTLLEGEEVVVENGVPLTDEEPGDEPASAVAPSDAENPSIRSARIYFGADSIGTSPHTLQPWRDGEAPRLMTLHPLIDPDFKRAALDLEEARKRNEKDVDVPGETVAPKGEIKGGTGPMTPAERLGLTGVQRAKHERCLANAIYFEARGEVERGQMAVAQVVLNRAFSGYYPDNVCGVVYQNAHRHLACQFTFACDNVRDVVTEPEAWETAKRIARDTLDGKLWVSEVGMSTHYHATYVHPWWVRTMRKQHRLGIHIFYRPTRWGDGADAPKWGPAASAVQSVGQAKL